MQRHAPLLILGLVLLLVGCGSATAGSQPARSSGSPVPYTNASPVVPPVPQGACVMAAGSYPIIPDVDQLTWASHRIVIGTVMERLPSVPRPDAPRSPLYTDYVVKVERSFRGTRIETLHIRRSGGAIGDCTSPEGGPPLRVGDRLLLFLNYPQPDTVAPTYEVTGEDQGYSRLDANEVVTEATHPGLRGKTIAQVVQQLARVLAGPPPSRPIVGYIPVVPPERAPRGPDLPAPPTGRP